MLATGVKEEGRDETVKVQDIAELVIEAIVQGERPRTPGPSFARRLRLRMHLRRPIEHAARRMFSPATDPRRSMIPSRGHGGVAIIYARPPRHGPGKRRHVHRRVNPLILRRWCDARRDPAIRWFHDCRTVRQGTMTTLHTVGHGTLPAEKFASLLDGAHVARLVDVRSFPGSRHNPQFAREEMERWVPDAESATSGCANWAVGVDRWPAPSTWRYATTRSGPTPTTWRRPPSWQASKSS